MDWCKAQQPFKVSSVGVDSVTMLQLLVLCLQHSISQLSGKELELEILTFPFKTCIV